MLSHRLGYPAASFLLCDTTVSKELRSEPVASCIAVAGHGSLASPLGGLYFHAVCVRPGDIAVVASWFTVSLCDHCEWQHMDKLKGDAQTAGQSRQHSCLSM